MSKHPYHDSHVVGYTYDSDEVSEHEITCIEIVPQCQGCKKYASEIEEIQINAAYDDMEPNTWVKDQEGTYNSFNGHFLCNACYIKSGMPTNVNRKRWICP